MIKKFFVTAIVLSTSAIAGWCAGDNTAVMQSPSIMKALPIYSNSLIDKAPEGDVITGVRDCYTSYFQYGDYYRAFENGVIGEYVIGADGNVYLRPACYSAARISDATDTYLKLEKVDETTYVAHTPQLIWVDNVDEGTPFTAYATRVVFSQKSGSSFGYEIQPNGDGSYNTDIYFTLKDGCLSQMNQNICEMNGELFPEELVGFTTSTGGWIGFGDGCITVYQPEEEPVKLPDNAEVVEKSLDYNMLHVRDIVLNSAEKVKYAEVDNNLYLSNPSAGTEQWIKGTIDRGNNTVTFESQYLGIDTVKGYAVWFVPATYNKYIEILNEETGFGDWFRNYEATEKLTLKYENGKLSSVSPAQAILFSHSPKEILPTGVFADPAVVEYNEGSYTPAPVTFTKFEEYDDLWGFGVVGFAIPCMSDNGIYINPSELYYNFYIDGSSTPFVFSPSDYIDMVVDPMTDVPYSYIEDFDFKVSGINHTVYFYHDWETIGVQVIQKYNGKETRSEIVYAGKGGLGAINDVTVQPEQEKTYKYIQDGKIIIVHNGVKYNCLGVPIK